MELFFSPLACSMATRIALYEAGIEARFVQVDTTRQRTADGADYRQLNPLGMVPSLRTEQGDVLTENAAILQYVADWSQQVPLAPKQGLARARLQQWLCFIGTELHKGLFTPLLDKQASEGVRAYALGHAASRLALLEAHLAEHEFLLDSFSVADAYLFTVLGWAQATPVDLGAYGALRAYLARLLKRPSISRAVTEERALYAAQMAARR